ncbi:hypothetical protein [Streptomyces radicis]|nr:hypothetical protein [Streptomyces radicis]
MSRHPPDSSAALITGVMAWVRGESPACPVPPMGALTRSAA